MRTSSTETSRNDWRTWSPEEKRLYLEKLDRAIERTETGAVTGPNKRQAEFLAYDGEFAVYGGAAGASKTVAMLLWLLEGVEHRNFSGLFLRRTFAQLEGSPTSPIDFSFSLFPRYGGQARDGGKVWKWDNGATIRFGHMQYEESKYNYQGPAFHRVCYDELTQFSRTQFEYMFTRLRRVIDYPIPVGIRASCNPAANWVKSDLISEEAQRAIKQLSVYDPTPAGMVFDCPGFDGKFFPARVADNPAYDTQEYIDRIRHRVGAALAAQLAAGDWSAIEGAIISAEDLRYYRMRGELLEAAGAVKDCRTCYRFTTTDTAGTSKQRAAEARGKNPSHSVTAVWDYWPEMGLFLRHVWRKQVDWPELKQAAAAIREQWGGRPLIENAHFGPALAGELGGATLVPTKLPGMEGQVESAKYDRAIASGLITQIEEGKIWLPEVGAVAGASAWMPEFEAELLGWTGHPDDPADQIDVCSHAANHVKSSRRRWGGVIDSKSMRVGRRG